MPHLSVDVPRSLSDRLRRLAEAEGVSVEQLVASALTEKVAALETEAYLALRARRADRAAYGAALAGAPDVAEDAAAAVRDVKAARRED